MTTVPPIAASDDSFPIPSESSLKRCIVNLLLQISQRLGAISLLATLGTWALLYLKKDVSIILAVVAGAGLVGVGSALIASVLTEPRITLRREANGVAIFNGMLLILAVQLMLYFRLEGIHASFGEFFTSTPLNPPALPMPHSTEIGR